MIPAQLPRGRDDQQPTTGRSPTNIDNDGREGNGLTSHFFIGLLDERALNHDLAAEPIVSGD